MNALRERVIADAASGALLRLIAEWSAATDERASIALALRLDLPLLITRHELVVPCVVRRCAWLGGWLQGRSLHSLRPPVVPLDGGVIEEYRTDAKGELWFSIDARHIGVGDVAWDRASGERVHDARPPARPLPRWRLDAEKAEWGSGVVLAEESTARWPFAHSSEERAWNLVELGDDLALLGCAGSDPYGCGDDEPAYYLMNLKNGELVWRAAGTLHAAALMGDRVFVNGYGSDVVAHSLVTGEKIGRWELAAGEIAFGRDGTIATRSESVIRVWDLARVPAEPAHGFGGDARLSPDETRLLTGDVLSDARTGREIARLDLHGVGSWLEGGPPADCRRLCDSVFMEITPMGFYAWETATGALLVEDRERSAETLDAVCFDPRGRFHAVWPGRERREGPNPLRLHALDGAIVFEQSVSLQPTESSLRYRLGFSPSGDELWWETRTGDRCVLTIATGSVRTLGPHEALPAEPEPLLATVVDGLLLAGDLALPIDSTTAIMTRDGSCFASPTAHYVVRG